MTIDSEIKNEKRFEFGRNWRSFLISLDKEQIKEAEKSLVYSLEKKSLNGLTFLDIGCGSGIFSLAARNLGAKVVSFDLDQTSVECAKVLKERFYNDDKHWLVLNGSVLDVHFMESLGGFDIVYSWGVLHHTGNMWEAINNAALSVAKKGQLFISLYNNQGLISKYWAIVKKLYITYSFTRPIFIFMHTIYPAGPSFLSKRIRGIKIPRGMNFWNDLIDWLGGYPFEVATRCEVVKFMKKKNFKLGKVISVGKKLGCNEFIFEKN